MTFRFEERPLSRQTSTVSPEETRVYFASGSTSVEYVRSMALLSTPTIVSTVMGLLWRKDVQINPEGADHFEVVVPYGPKGSSTLLQAGDYRLNFDTTGGTVHVKASKETVGKYPSGTTISFKQLIGVNGDQVDGTDVVIPALKISVSFRHPAGIITLARIKNLARKTAYVNSDNFLTFSPGEVLFLGASGSEGSDCEAEVTYHFACSENVTGLSIGDVAGIAKKGHEYVWIRWEDGVDGGQPIVKPRYVYVERLYDTTSFPSLFGFGA